MKKLMALCLAAVMALSMCAFTVMAEGEAVAFETISNGQLQDFIVGNLAIPEGATVTSSNEAVVSTAGVVTRPIFDDETVTLTVNGTAFELTVKSLKVLGATEALTFEGIDAGTSILGTTGWPATLASNTSGEVEVPGTATVAASSTGNKYAKIGIAANYGECGYTFQTVPAINQAETITLQFDLAYVSKSACYNYDLRINNVTLARLVMLSGNIYPWDLTSSSSWHGTDRSPAVVCSVSDTAFQKVIITINKEAGTVDFNVNGTQLDTRNVAGTTDLSNITAIKFVPKGRDAVSDGALNNYTLIDNVIVYGETTDAATILANATAQQRLDYLSATYLSESYVTNNGTFSALANDVVFTADSDIASLGATLSWTSSNEAVIAADGTVNQPLFEAETVTLTGTLTVDDLAPATETYTVTVLPATISAHSEVLDFEAYTAGTAIESDDNWTKAVTHLTAAVAEEADGNSYLKLTTDGSTTGGTTGALIYEFNSTPDIAGANTYVMEMDVHMPEADTSAINLALMLDGVKSAEVMLGSAGYNGYIYGGGLLTSNIWHTRGTGVRAGTAIPTSDFVHVKTVINVAEGKVYYYQNDVLTETVTYTEGTTYCPDLTSVDAAKFYVNWRSSTGEVWIDNVKLYTESTLESVIANLSDAKKVEFYEELISATELGSVNTRGTVLDLDSTYADYDPATYGASIEWTSSNTAYVSNDGTVTDLADLFESVSVNMTATITVGEESATVTIPVTITDGTVLVASYDFEDESLLTNTTNVTIVEDDAEHGKVGKVVNETSGGHVKASAISAFDGADCKDRVILKADVKYENGASASYGSLQICTIAGRGGISVGLNYDTEQIKVLTTAPYLDASGSTAAVDEGYALYYDMPESVKAKGEGAWVEIMVDHNVLAQTMNVYVDGILLNELPILQAYMKLPDNGGSAIRSYGLELSNMGTMWIDNVSFHKFASEDEVEVNAALNAALIDYAQPLLKPVLTNGSLPSMTIGKSWYLSGTKFNRDILESGSYNPLNPSTYTYVTDGPAVTWTVNGAAATELAVTSPGTAEITVTATNAAGYSESKTFTRAVAPAAIWDLGVNGSSAFNGIWLENVEEGDKVIIGLYLGSQLVDARVHAISAENENYDATTGILKGLALNHPKSSADFDQVKVFVVGDNGITPIAYANAELHD